VKNLKYSKINNRINKNIYAKSPNGETFIAKNVRDLADKIIEHDGLEFKNDASYYNFIGTLRQLVGPSRNTVNG